MDLSLDEIIQSKRKTIKPKQTRNLPTQRGRITKRNSAPLPVARSWNNNNNYSNTNSGNKPWEHDMFRGNRASNQQNDRNGTKIEISNLDFGVNNDDINELFKEFGQVLKAGVNYDRSGRSTGMAEVVYLSKTSAVMARNKYHGIPLDNKPMSIILVDTVVSNRPVGDRLSRPSYNDRRPPPTAMNRSVNNNFNGRPSSNRPNNNRVAPSNNSRPRDMTKKKAAPKTKEQLDAEMDDYLTKTD